MSISTVASQCAKLLAQTQSNRALSPTVRLSLENILVRLKIWAGNVGVFAPDNASVEYRLRREADIMDVLLSMLTSLKAHLERAINPPLLEELEEEQPPSPSSDSDSSSSSLTLDSDAAEDEQDTGTQNDLDSNDPIQRANDVIDRLYRLASVVRKPVSSTENSRVRDFIAKEKSRGHTQDLEDAEDHARRHMQARFAKAPQVLVDRLVAAVVFRRMKLRYRQRHQQKLKQGVESSFAMEASGGKRLVTEYLGTPTILPAVPVPNPGVSSTAAKHNIPRRGRSVVWSATDASSVNQARFVNYAKSTALSGITLTAVARRQKLDVPPPPKNFDKRLRKVTCCYCTRMLSIEETREPRWTRHILKDIDPYVCLFEDCGQGDVLFASSEEWLGHMQWQHTVVWSCQAPGHEQHIYGTEVELKEHIQHGHPGSFTESQLPHLVKQGALPAANTFALLALSFNPGEIGGQPAVLCPICHNFPSPSAETEEGGADHLKNIQNHIMAHLEAIALLSLPEDGGPDGSESNVKHSSENSVAVVRDVDDLPPATFDDELSVKDILPQISGSDYISDTEIPVPPVLDHEETWAYVFQVVTQPQLPEPGDDPLLLEWHKRTEALLTHSQEKGVDLQPQHRSEADMQLQATERARKIQEASLADDVPALLQFLEENAVANTKGADLGGGLAAAASRDNEEIIQLLLDGGADINGQGELYGNALQTAADWGRERVVTMLLERGADVNLRSGGYSGRTALHLAALSGHVEVTRLLIHAGADREARDKAGDTPLDLAIKKGHSDVERLLSAAGTDIDKPTLDRPTGEGNSGVASTLINANAPGDAKKSDQLDLSNDGVILLLGGHGAGKTHFLKSLQSYDNVQVVDLPSRSEYIVGCCLAQIHLRDDKKRTIRVIDTTGLDAPTRPHGDGLREIVDFLTAQQNAGAPLRGIIYLQTINDDRMRGSSLAYLRLLESLGEKLNKVALVTTMWNSIPKEDFPKAYLREITLINRFWGPLCNKGACVAQFDGTADSAHSIILQLARMDSVVLDFRKAVLENGSFPGNSPDTNLVS
ncbi:hypothetical protein B0T10DRAFT_73728 [Thelonectria olida]|uniref:Uncharacterized protein n=1 Tax=Thelonectria olida TaxID=1576542 RepID=A0A9P8W169_9HYPO|nr:hypothetical protein B0T10DRAFT_73728 [Thelonectria olida]